MLADAWPAIDLQSFRSEGPSSGGDLAWPPCQHQPWQADFFLRATVYLVVTLVVMGILGAATVVHLRPPWYQTMLSSYLQAPPSQQELVWATLCQFAEQAPQYAVGALALAQTAWTTLSGTTIVVAS